MAIEQARLGNAIGALRVLGIIASVIAGMAIALVVMISIAGTGLPDIALIALGSAGSLAAIIWARMGAKPLSKWLYAGSFMPCIMLGICVLMGAYERYPIFLPWLMGILGTLIFVIVGLATSWRAISKTEGFSVDGASDGQLGKVIPATLVFIFVGVLFFQPILVLLNGQSQLKPPLVAVGTVAQAYETHGKGAADYLVLAGPAAVFHSTWTAGEFEVDGPTYRSSPVGSRKCVTIRMGILHFRWWSINDC